VHLIQRRAQERRVVRHVRVPHAVQRAEPSRGERLVHRRIAPDPRIALRDGAREGRQTVGEVVVEETRAERAAAVVYEADDRLDVQRTKPLHRGVRPGEGRARGAQPLQCIEADGIGRQQVGQVNPDRAGRVSEGGAQFMHLRGVQPSGEVNRASSSLLLNLNAALHESLPSKVGTM